MRILWEMNFKIISPNSMKNIKMTSPIKYLLAKCETMQNLFQEREQLVAKVILILIARNIAPRHQI